VLIPYQEHVLPMIPSGGTVRDIIKSWPPAARASWRRQVGLVPPSGSD